MHSFLLSVPSQCGTHPVDRNPPFCQNRIKRIKQLAGYNPVTNRNPEVDGNICNAKKDPFNWRYQLCCASCASLCRICFKNEEKFLEKFSRRRKSNVQRPIIHGHRLSSVRGRPVVGRVMCGLCFYDFFYCIIQLAAANKQCRLGEVVSRCRASCGYCSTPLVNTMWTTAKRTCVLKRRKIENSFCP
jgi:hypothetical protein